MKHKLGCFPIWFFFIGIYLFPFLFMFLSEYSYVFEDLQLNPNDYARITDVEYNAVVLDEPGSEGTVLITERLTFDVHAASEDNLFWELWRDLPEDYVDGVKVDYKVHSVKQILEDGTEIIYDESPKLYWEDEDYVSSNRKYGPGKWYHSEGPYDESDAQYECVFFYVDGLYREQVVFEIVYEMHNAALRYNDCSDLYLALYSGATIKHLNSFKAQILFPDEDMPSPGNYEVYTYGTNYNEFPVTESDTLNPGYHTFSFELNEEQLQFKPYNQYIEFDLVAYGEDKHIFTEYAPSNDYTSDNVLDEIFDEQQEYAAAPQKFRQIKLIVFLLALLIVGLMMRHIFTTDSRMKSKHIFYEPSMEMEYFREIPSDLDPNFAAALVYCKQNPPKDDSGVYSAILLSLARKEYIKLVERATDDVLIVIQKPELQVPEPPALSGLESSTIVNAFGTSETLAAAETPASAETVEPSETVDTFDTIDTFNTFDTLNTFESANSFDSVNSLEPVDTLESINSLEPVDTLDSVDTPASIDTFASVNTFAPVSSFEPIESLEPVDTREPLTPCEQYYFNLLVRHAVDDQILMSAFQFRVSHDYANTDSFVRDMESSIVNIGIREGYFQKADYAQPKNEMRSSAKFLWITGILLITLVNIISYHTRLDLAFGAFFILGIICMISSVCLKKQSSKYVLLTQFGEDEYAKWRGLYNFLNSETLIHERTIIELPLWEKYLVYATAFGLSEKVINAISIRCPETASSPVLSNTYYRSRSFRHSGRSFRSAVRSGSSAARGGGSGFGYGGGGRGGGGGGGGH